MFIGRNGFTASAIRDGIHISLQIHSHEEEQQRIAEIEAKEILDQGNN